MADSDVAQKLRELAAEHLSKAALLDAQPVSQRQQQQQQQQPPNKEEQ
jgi:hypothetical protein